MCGIVGAASARNVVPILIEGIRRLEYRGYDSTGLAVLNGAQGTALTRLVSTERVADLDAQAKARKITGTTGISHTRWATHGAPSTVNAHPHVSDNEIAVVHNGIIENFETLRERLRGQGYAFRTQTDSETIAHLVHAHWHGAANGDLVRAVQLAVAEFEGAYAIAVISAREPGRVVGARQGSPLVVGIGADDHFLASDAAALVPVTRRVAYLEEGDVADVRTGSYAIYDRSGQRVERVVVDVPESAAAVELGPYRHFMQKEIFEQPRAVADTLEAVQSIDPALFGVEAASLLRNVDSVLILACGTSHYSSIVAKQWIETLAGIPCAVEIASEYRYRVSVPNPKALVVVVSQSGETADTLAALKHAKSLGHTRTLAVCNVATSSMMRETVMKFQTRAGTEVGVASTKAFTTQLVALFLLACTLAKLRRRLSDGTSRWMRGLRHLPAAIQGALALEPHLMAWAQAFAKKEHALFLGRGLHFPSRSRARSSSRKFRTSMPRRMRPVSSSTGRSRWSIRRCPSSQSRPTMRCSRSSRATCRKSVRAAASSMSSRTSTAAFRAATARISCACRSTRASCRPIVHVFRCSFSRITSRCCAAPTSTSRAKPQRRA
jgi:glucosamine--fructose-6-phosphate aminotransferase (isomerizing)